MHSSLDRQWNVVQKSLGVNGGEGLDEQCGGSFIDLCERVETTLPPGSYKGSPWEDFRGQAKRGGPCLNLYPLSYHTAHEGAEL